MDHRCVDHHVVVEELGGSGRVGHDPAYGSRHQEDESRLIGPEPVVHGGLISEVELFVARHEDVGVAIRAKLSDKCGSHQSRVTCLRKCGHPWEPLSSCAFRRSEKWGRSRGLGVGRRITSPHRDSESNVGTYLG